MCPTRRDSAHGHGHQATFNTLNYALGNLGGKQKSWMTAAQTSHNPPPASVPVKPQVPTKRKRGRPPIKDNPNIVPTPARPSLPQPEHQTPRPLGHPTHVRPSTSNSTSPQLANIVPNPHRPSPLQSPQAVLPSPAPSEDANPEPAVPISMVDHGVGATSSTGTMGPDVSYQNHVGTATDTVRPSFELSNGANNGRRSVPDMTHIIQAAMAPRTVAPNIAFPNGTTPQTLNRGQGMAGTANSGPAANQLRPQPVSATPRHQENPRRSSLGLQEMQSRPPSRTLTHPTTPQQPHSPFGLQGGLSTNPYAIPADYYARERCQRALHEFFTTPRKITFAGQRRVDMVKAASIREDGDFLHIHQIYCLSSVDPDRIPQNLKNYLPDAHRMLAEVLFPNDTLPPDILRFFAVFPIPLAEIAVNWPQSFAQQQATFVHFASRSGTYPKFRGFCLQRRCPPVVSEMVQNLGVSSPLLQEVIFISIVKQLSHHFGIPPVQLQSAAQKQALSKLEMDVRAILHSNQTEYFQRQGQPPGPQEEWPRWGVQLSIVCEQHAQFLSSGQVPSYNQIPQQIQQHQLQQPHQQHQQLQQQMQDQNVLRSNAPFVQPTVFPPMPQATHLSRQSHNFSVAPPPSPRTLNPRAARSTPLQSPLLPPPGKELLMHREPTPAKLALHHANLRSPKLRAQGLGSPLYGYVEQFAKPPTRLSEAGRRIERWSLSVSADEKARIPADAPGAMGEPATRTINENSRLLRLRCVKWPSAELPDQHAWATADTSWIPSAYFTFNGVTLHPRRKIYYGKDLPIDLTGLIKEGENTLEIAVSGRADDERYLGYLLAIEAVGFKTLDDIKHCCLTENRLKTADALDQIKRKVVGPSDADGDGDDEIAIVQSSLTINLFDPFSGSQMCEIPVRSRACLHSDCFDLETFLRTRKHNGAGISANDAWRCPICNADARPQSLIVDGFLQAVGEELVRRGSGHTRAIVFDQEGQWRPKLDAHKATGDRSRTTSEPAAVALGVPRTTPADADVIDISD